MLVHGLFFIEDSFGKELINGFIAIS